MEALLKALRIIFPNIPNLRELEDIRSTTGQIYHLMQARSAEIPEDGTSVFLYDSFDQNLSARVEEGDSVILTGEILLTMEPQKVSHAVELRLKSNDIKKGRLPGILPTPYVEGLPAINPHQHRINVKLIDDMLVKSLFPEDDYPPSVFA